MLKMMENTNSDKDYGLANKLGRFIYKQAGIGKTLSNVARGKQTKQSSTGFCGVSSKAVDGNRNSNYGGKSCTYTNKQAGAWWRVDLGRMSQVGRVRLTNRGDCYSNRLSNFDIRVGNRDNNRNANALKPADSASLHYRSPRKFVDEYFIDLSNISLKQEDIKVFSNQNVCLSP